MHKGTTVFEDDPFSVVGDLSLAELHGRARLLESAGKTLQASVPSGVLLDFRPQTG